MITPSTLGQKIAAKKAEEEAQQGAASFHYVLSGPAPLFIEFRPDARTRVGFSFTQLCHYTLEPNPYPEMSVAPERLTLGFSSADVMVYGARLLPVVEHVVKHGADWIACVSERYANVNERPWVGRIDIQPYGKPTPSSSSAPAEDRGPVRTSLRDLNEGNTEPLPLPPDPAPSRPTARRS
jgi:hypothetical protein